MVINNANCFFVLEKDLINAIFLKPKHSNEPVPLSYMPS